MDINNCQVYFASDLKDYGYTEDGEKFIGEIFFVEIEDAKGNRWRHRTMQDGVRKELWEEGTAYMDDRPRAREVCGRMVDRIKSRGFINMVNWYEVPAAYGSDAYITGGWEAHQIALERMEG